MATAEIARSVQLAASGTGRVSAEMSGLMSAASENGDMSRVVQQAADGVLSQIAAVDGEVQHFLAGIRAA